MVAQSEEKRSIPVAALIATLAVLICGGGAGWYLTRPVIAQQDAPTSPEAKAYVKNLRLAEVEMKATDSFASQRLVEILGKITNLFWERRNFSATRALERLIKIIQVCF